MRHNPFPSSNLDDPDYHDHAARGECEEHGVKDCPRHAEDARKAALRAMVTAAGKPPGKASAADYDRAIAALDVYLAPSLEPLDAEVLARAQDNLERRHHDPEYGPYRGLDDDPILASMMREEAAELIAEYQRLLEARGEPHLVPFTMPTDAELRGKP